MFEQTLLNKPDTARKPYSMVVSLVAQILAIGSLCLVPIVFPEAFSNVRLKSLVLAAPPKPPAALKMKSSATRLMVARPGRFVFVPLQMKVAAARTDAAVVPSALDVDGVAVSGGGPDGVGPSGVLGSLPVPPPAPVAKPKPALSKPIRVGTIAGANLIRMVPPVYPPLARSSRVQGSVEFTATISREGTIENLTLLRGHPLLVNAARDAVLQWRYRPTLLNGEPVEVITDIVVNFTLNQ